MREAPSLKALMLRVATLLGQEAALFVPTATMANQIALKLHARPGDVLIAEEHSHARCTDKALHFHIPSHARQHCVACCCKTNEAGHRGARDKANRAFGWQSQDVEQPSRGNFLRHCG